MGTGRKAPCAAMEETRTTTPWPWERRLKVSSANCVARIG